MTKANTRNWDELVKRHTAFWECGETDRPLVVALFEAYQDTTLVAQAVGEGELHPDRVDPGPILSTYDRMAAVHEQIGDDMLPAAEALLGIPWLEAICGCRVMVPDGKSLWPEKPSGEPPQEIVFDEKNPWFICLLQVIREVVSHAAGRYPVSMSHLRGPTDILSALYGSQAFLTGLMDDPDRLAKLASQAAQVWKRVAGAQEALIPPYRGGYSIRQFGIWSPGRSAWLQDDTSSMLSLRHYRRVFLEPMKAMSTFPYGVLHLHAPSLHLAETLAEVPNIRAINIYFDSPTITLEKAAPILQRLQAKQMPLVLTKEVYRGFEWEEYEFLRQVLSPRGLSVHLRAESIEEGREVMARLDH